MRPSQRRPVFHPVTGKFVGFTGDPGTQAVRNGGVQPVLQNRVFVRRSRPQGMAGYAGLGGSNASDRGSTDRILPDGTPGNLWYDETNIWGTGNENDQVVAPIDPSTPVDMPAGPQLFDPGISIPFGVSIIPWRNPTTMQSVPIIASTPSNVPVLSLNMQRNSLLVQNNSTATAPDIAATFWLSFNSQPQVGLSLSLAPGAGILFDVITPRDSVFILSAGATGASAVTQGVVVQGTYAPI